MNLQARTLAGAQPRQYPVPGSGLPAALWPSAGGAARPAWPATCCTAPVAAVVALAAVVAAVCAVAVLRPVLLGDERPTLALRAVHAARLRPATAARQVTDFPPEHLSADR